MIGASKKVRKGFLYGQQYCGTDFIRAGCKLLDTIKEQGSRQIHTNCARIKEHKYVNCKQLKRQLKERLKSQKQSLIVSVQTHPLKQIRGGAC